MIIKNFSMKQLKQQNMNILVELGNTQLEQIEDLQSFSDSGVIGKPVKAKLIRAGALQEISITVGERPGK